MKDDTKNSEQQNLEKSSIEQSLELQVLNLTKEKEDLLTVINNQIKQINSLKADNDKNQVTIDALQEKLVRIIKLYNTLLDKGNKEG